MHLCLHAYVKHVCFGRFSPASELMLRPAPAPAARDCSAPREAMVFTDVLVLEVGEEPAVERKQNRKGRWISTKGLQKKMPPLI